ncbi:MAG: hypothetical protein KAR21_13030 [Spirochaetales bacterium]|nr:hypothetical protein [Spirochaetales bacterium]
MTDQYKRIAIVLFHYKERPWSSEKGSEKSIIAPMDDRIVKLEVSFI